MAGNTKLQWTDDCQGKKSYDGALLSVDSRYWPGNYRPDGKPSAQCLILLFDELIDSAQFAADTEAAVMLEVEAYVATWVQRLRRLAPATKVKADG